MEPLARDNRGYWKGQVYIYTYVVLFTCVLMQRDQNYMRELAATSVVLVTI